MPRLSTKLGKRKPDKGNEENLTLEERLALLNTSSLNTKVTKLENLTLEERLALLNTSSLNTKVSLLGQLFFMLHRII